MKMRIYIIKTDNEIIGIVKTRSAYNAVKRFSDLVPQYIQDYQEMTINGVKSARFKAGDTRYICEGIKPDSLIYQNII